MAYRHDGSGMGGGPLPEKTQGWLWGFLFGTGFGVAVVFVGPAFLRMIAP